MTVFSTFTRLTSNIELRHNSNMNSALTSASKLLLNIQPCTPVIKEAKYHFFLRTQYPFYKEITPSPKIMFSQTITDSSLEYSVILELEITCPHLTCYKHDSYNCFLFPITVATTRNRSVKLIVLLWKLTTLKHPQCFYVLPHLQTWMTGVRLYFCIS